MEQVRIQISPKQQSKLRNGHKVRIKKPRMEGEGLSLIVNPMNYSLITKAFTKNKGTEIILSPDEILANKEQAPTMEGEGIFGKKFDKRVEKAIGKRGRKKVYGFAKDVLNPIAKTALYAGIASGATALSALQPELIPLILPASAGTADFLGDYLDKPSDFYSKSGPREKKAKQLGKQYLQQQALNQLNSQLGTNMGYMTQAGIGKAVQDKASQALSAGTIQAQKALIDRLNAGIENASTLSAEEKALLKGTSYSYLSGSGLGAGLGAGLYAGKGLGAGLGAGLYASAKRGGSIVGLRAGMVNTTPQALQSQPMSANFQFRYTLPVAFQSLVK
jgi:hypothetical protein